MAASVGISPPPSYSGENLLDRADGTTESTDDRIAVTISQTPVPSAAARDDRYTLLVDLETEVLFDRDSNPNEQQPLSRNDPNWNGERIKDLSDAARAAMRAISKDRTAVDNGRVSKTVDDRLKQLGYR